MSQANIEQLPGLIREIYKITNRLGEMFPSRKFTPDGHLVGSIGEVLAAANYRLTLMDSMSEKGHDAVADDGKLVQVKATQGRSVALREEPDYLLVLRITERGEAEEIYNGPGRLPWERAGKMQKSNGQRAISFARLEPLMADVVPVERIPRR